MDSLRISLLVIGVVFIALIYAWGRMKRGKDESRYARWGGVADEETEPHVAGRYSGDLETDTELVANAYDVIDEEHEDAVSPNYDDVETDSDVTEVYAEPEAEAEFANHPDEDSELDLDSDPELAEDPLDDITSELEALEEIIAVDQKPEQIELDEFDIPLEEPDAVRHEPDRIIVVHVLAREGSVFTGPDILSSLMHVGMQYGDMNVFHCYGQNNKSVFSLVNAVEPGIFDISAMDEMTTPALLFMMSIPNPLPALEAYDGMLETARALASSLDGRLCDDRRSVLTRQAIDEQRAELASL